MSVSHVAVPLIAVWLMITAAMSKRQLLWRPRKPRRRRHRAWQR
jgi:hypothetical protein